MPETIFGYVDQLTTPELANTMFGTVVGAVAHMVGEGIADGYFKDRYPENYEVYSTLAVTGVMSAIGIGLWLYSRGKAGMEFVQYLVAGIFVVELVQILDIVRVQLTTA